MSQFKDYSPEDVKLNTCAAVAYSILTGIDYDKALKILPNGRYDTIEKAMNKFHLDPIDGNGLKLKDFSLQNPKGKFFVCLSDGKQGHAIALIDRIGYNMQSFNDQSIIDRYYDFSKVSHTTNDTAYTDEDNSSLSISKNKYVVYAYLSIIQKAGSKLTNNFGKINTKVQGKNSNGFTLTMNGKHIDFNFPLNCTDRDVINEIDRTIDEFCKKL